MQVFWFQMKQCHVSSSIQLFVCWTEIATKKFSKLPQSGRDLNQASWSLILFIYLLFRKALVRQGMLPGNHMLVPLAWISNSHLSWNACTKLYLSNHEWYTHLPRQTHQYYSWCLSDKCSSSHMLQWRNPRMKKMEDSKVPTYTSLGLYTIHESFLIQGT